VTPFSSQSTSEKEKTSTLVPQVPEVSKPILQAPPTKKTSPLSPSSSGSANIICHRYKGMGHVMSDCPSMHAYIATGDGGYESVNNVEDEYRVAANLYAEEKAAGENGETIDSNTMTSHLRSILVQHALSAQPVPSDKIQRHNLFHIFLVVNNCPVLTIIDGGSCNNLVSSDLFKKLGLTTHALPQPYEIQWFDTNGKEKVTHSARPFVRPSLGI